MVTWLTGKRSDFSHVQADKRQFSAVLSPERIKATGIARDQTGHLEITNEIFQRKLEARQFHDWQPTNRP